MQEYKYHRFADAFPMMSALEYRELVADINAHGQREPITRYQQEILDGRNRDKACQELGIKPMYTDFEGNDEEALALAISMNVVRRHLSQSQLAMVAADLSGLQPGQHGDQGQALPIGRAAAKLNVGERTVARARKVKENSPELAAKVRAGEVTVSAAVAQLEAPPTRIGAADGHADPDADLDIPNVDYEDETDEKVVDELDDLGVGAPDDASDAADPVDQGVADAADVRIDLGRERIPPLSFSFERADGGLAKYVPEPETIDAAQLILMNIKTLDEWLAASPDGFAQLGAHMSALSVEQPVHRRPKTKARSKVKSVAKSNKRKASVKETRK
jgi:ParB-like chromosome segregation protein Spo0J